ncbi:hypothetical protein FF38_12688 [Lucilia cuprina]|uniref:Protein TsetseEP domain-containing protein n=1 Tax=Lucilia cuprina TaxID=7375 RepID=A0A0L0C411_LUCCU|nr:hypothetical protein CVS40_7851 [Lucilia cuprina]KNC27093.1 hypothetical protein FF38_12688 [Lucilia cuprina]
MSKICAIFMVLFLAQAALAKPSESSVEKDLTPKQELAGYIGISLIALIQDYSEKCIKVSREILRDEDFLARHEPMFVEFKQNLTKFVDAYEAAADAEKKFDILDMFSNTSDFYYEIPEDKYTPESKYIVDVLNKYHYRDIESEMEKEFSPFVEQVMKIFEENKSALDKPTLAWFEKYQHMSDFEEKLNAFSSLLEMLTENE